MPPHHEAAGPRRCPNCNALNFSKTKFCPECGVSQPLSGREAAVVPRHSTEQSPFFVSAGSYSANKSATKSEPSTPLRYRRATVCILAASIVCFTSWSWFAAHPLTAQGQYELGLKYAKGRKSAKSDAESAMLFRKAADHGHAKAQYFLGADYGVGFGVEKDDVQSVYWLRKAAEQGNTDAQVALGVMYGTGRGLVKDSVAAANWYQKAAEKGDANGQYNLGVMYHEGLGVRKDEAQAAHWWHEAAEQGQAEAESNLGAMYQEGRGGLREDHVEALLWLTKAAEQGNSDAEHNLANAYSNGWGTRKNDVKATDWYRKAAEQGDAMSAFNVGAAYEKGSGGLPKDDAEALLWYQRSADHGFTQALDAVASIHTRQQEGQARAKAVNGEAIDFTTLYVQGVTRSLVVDQRYRFRAEIDLYETNGTNVRLAATDDASKGLLAVLALDSTSPVTRQALLSGGPRQTHTVVGSCCIDSAFMIERIE